MRQLLVHARRNQLPQPAASSCTARTLKQLSLHSAVAAGTAAGLMPAGAGGAAAIGTPGSVSSTAASLLPLPLLLRKTYTV